MKVCVTRDRAATGLGKCVALWGHKDQQGAIDDRWSGYWLLCTMCPSAFKDLFGFTPRRGSRTEMTITARRDSK